jgi:hypothetical protein
MDRNSPDRLPPRHLASAEDLRQAHDVARAIAVAALGRDPGVMTAAESISHYAYVGADIVVKIIDAGRHTRLDREIALAPQLPAGLTAPLLASGLYRSGPSDVRYACYTRMPGTVPGMGMPGVDATVARLLASEAVQRLQELHSWAPTGQANATLRETLDHGGFVTQAALLAEVEKLAAANRDGIVPRHLLAGLAVLAQHAAPNGCTVVPVHADCHWGNWLASGRHVTALLDFEWARFGEPPDDWYFLIAFSGPHRETVLDVVARETSTAPDDLRAQCEIRGATFLASDLRMTLEDPDVPARIAADLLRKLEELIVGRLWWRRPR